MAGRDEALLSCEQAVHVSRDDFGGRTFDPLKEQIGAVGGL
jgi:hypothetical protein